MDTTNIDGPNGLYNRSFLTKVGNWGTIEQTIAWIQDVRRELTVAKEDLEYMREHEGLAILYKNQVSPEAACAALISVRKSEKSWSDFNPKAITAKPLQPVSPRPSQLELF